VRTLKFTHLCLSFQEQIKSNARVSAIFLTTQIATGFVDLAEAIREFREKNRELWKEVLTQLSVILEAIKISERRFGEGPRLRTRPHTRSGSGVGRRD
jgi:hypothetical protein